MRANRSLFVIGRSRGEKRGLASKDRAFDQGNRDFDRGHRVWIEENQVRRQRIGVFAEGMVFCTENKGGEDAGTV